MAQGGNPALVFSWKPGILSFVHRFKPQEANISSYHHDTVFIFALHMKEISVSKMMTPNKYYVRAVHK